MSAQIDTLTLAWATHRLGGIQTPANAAYSAPELEHQLRDSGAKCLFTCLTLLPLALEAADKAGIPRKRIYLLELPEILTPGLSGEGHKTVDDLIAEGKDLPTVEALQWGQGEGARRSAFLCYSSGTSGLPVCLVNCRRKMKLTESPERCNDLASECDCERRADVDV